jgi:uncharacterized protein YaaW (UPF0174 family)
MKKHFVFLFGLIILSNTVLYAGGGKDVNGLRPGDYDDDGWAYVKDGWVPSPNGAAYMGSLSGTIVTSEEIVYEGTTDIPSLDQHVKGLGITGGVNAIGIFNQRDVYNLVNLISLTVDAMSDEEKGLLRATLSFGKDMEKYADSIINSPEMLRGYGQDITAEFVVNELDTAFKKGTGLEDYITGKSMNYGLQLDAIIREVIVKQLKVPRPKFTESADTVKGAIQRENWIAETLLDNFIASMTEEERLELAKIISEELAKEGIMVPPGASMAFASGGLIALRKSLGFDFFVYVVKVANTVVRFMTGKGLSLAANRLLVMTAKKAIGIFIPIIGIASLAWTIYDIPGLINPRNYDKYIPAIFIIGLNRLSSNTQ